MRVDLIVAVGGKFHAPCVKGEIGQRRLAIVIDGDGSIVAHPGVVDRHHRNDDTFPVDVGPQSLIDLGWVIGNNEHALIFVVEDGACYFHIASSDLINHACPVGTHVGPCDENAVLRIPLSSKTLVSC